MWRILCVIELGERDKLRSSLRFNKGLDDKLPTNTEDYSY